MEGRDKFFVEIEIMRNWIETVGFFLLVPGLPFTILALIRVTS